MATIVWIILFIFMFINNVYNARLNYDDIPKPITVYLSYLPCPNCEKWCANDSNYTCNYTCDDTRTNKNMFYVRDYNNYGNVQEFEEDLRKYVEIRDWWNPNQTFATDNEKPIKNSSMTYIKQLCNNKTTNFTCEQINSFYPLCTLDFKPYEAEMERVCQVLKECNEKQEHNWPDQIKITNECAGFDFGNHRFKDDTDKYWLLDVGWFDKFLPGFGLKCGINGRLEEDKILRAKQAWEDSQKNKVTIINNVNKIEELELMIKKVNAEKDELEKKFEEEKKKQYEEGYRRDITSASRDRRFLREKTKKDEEIAALNKWKKEVTNLIEKTFKKCEGDTLVFDPKGLESFDKDEYWNFCSVNKALVNHEKRLSNAESSIEEIKKRLDKAKIGLRESEMKEKVQKLYNTDYDGLDGNLEKAAEVSTVILEYTAIFGSAAVAAVVCVSGGPVTIALCAGGIAFGAVIGIDGLKYVCEWAGNKLLG
ncbi:hypothetical protein Mgra_00002508 [Meloidogyne graminicola]|uniref:Uncharacterized protein n=1 Tax=Meloidogyne graminicola TaxID=189291 RepID=A0A8S9ZWE8_9BILA|nr:hypothetical protein Mgra_00002508 [Meloidogyne graminicola]